jgi:hypothetical protein
MADTPRNRAENPSPAPEAAPPPTQRACGTMQVHQRLMRTNPAYMRARIASENYHHESMQRRALGLPVGRTGVTSIPIVVHVVFNTAAQNISDAQIQSQIAVLNRDYRLKNSDVPSIPAPFKPLAADARIEFALATTDPAGNATGGITRTQTSHASFTDDDGIKSAASGGADPWPADKYLNVWTAPRITSAQGDLLGYAQFPGGPAATDGVVILHTAFGTSGTAAPPFNLGRTATHEIGHWVNLRHIWGDDGNGCNGSDFVDDTPNQAGPNFGTPGFPHATCNNGPNGDMFMNYMDYVDDAAMFMFTTGQVDRMQAALDGDRSSIGTIAIVPGPGVGATLKLRDDVPPTLKFNEDGPSLKFRDDVPPTLKFNDDGPSLKFRDDNPPTLKFRDDTPPTLKFRDDGVGTLAQIDVGPTLKVRDDVKLPGSDKPPALDQPKAPVSDQGPFPPPGGSPPFGRAPFVLSTPHHSTAWMRSFPQVAQQTVAAYEQQIQQVEEALTAYMEADAAGQLRPEEQQQGDALYQEYQALVEEYRQLMGG